MRITMYELLGLVKDGKTPKRIIYDQYVYVWNEEHGNYERESDIDTSLNWDYIVVYCLNDPVEILNKSIEEKKLPEKLTPFEAPFLKNDKPDIRFRLIIDSINDICDYLKSKGE